MIDLAHEDGVARVRFDGTGQKVNLISFDFLVRLKEILATLAQEAAAGRTRAVIFESGRPGVFLAGADVNAFVEVALTGDAKRAAAGARAGQEAFALIAALPVPTLAAINGACLGGGLELALAATSRIAGDDEKVAIGLPEVKLGLIPGWGGTQRLSRLLGPSRALDLILTGRSLSGRQALKAGVVDAVVPAEGMAHAGMNEARRLAEGYRPTRKSWAFVDKTPMGRALVYTLARRKVMQQTRGHYPAPPAAIEAIRHGLRRPIAEGLAKEAELVGTLLVGPVSRSLVSLFLTSRASTGSTAGSTMGSDPDVPQIRRVAVLGAGTMGGGIAAVTALAGLPVRLRDVSAEALSRGMRVVREQVNLATRKGKLSESQARLREALVSPTVDDSGLLTCDLVIEAVVEDLEVKRQVLRTIEPRLAPKAIFATNTSSLSVGRLAEAAQRPGRVLGLHFFNPVAKMPLVEVVRGPATDPDAVEATVALARRIGKTPVVVADTPGFIVNRVLMPYLNGALTLVAGRNDAGPAITTIDRAMTDFGMPMGPFALLDQIGLDVAAHVAGVLEVAFAASRRGEGSNGGRLLRAMTQAGLLGRKAGRGFYRYAPTTGGREGKVLGLCPEALRLAATLSPEGAPGPLSPLPDPRGIASLLVGVMINEAALLLAEKAVDGPQVIDLAMVFGTGFPPWRGGLLRHADAHAGGHFYS